MKALYCSKCRLVTTHHPTQVGRHLRKMKCALCGEHRYDHGDPLVLASRDNASRQANDPNMLALTDEGYRTMHRLGFMPNRVRCTECGGDALFMDDDLAARYECICGHAAAAMYADPSLAFALGAYALEVV